MQAVSIGPLLFAGDRLAAIIGIGAFMAVTSILSSRLDARIGRWSTWVLIAGLIAARLAHRAKKWTRFFALNDALSIERSIGSDPKSGSTFGSDALAT